MRQHPEPVPPCFPPFPAADRRGFRFRSLLFQIGDDLFEKLRCSGLRKIGVSARCLSFIHRSLPGCFETRSSTPDWSRIAARVERVALLPEINFLEMAWPGCACIRGFAKASRRKLSQCVRL